MIIMIIMLRRNNVNKGKQYNKYIRNITYICGVLKSCFKVTRGTGEKFYIPSILMKLNLLAPCV